MEQPILSFLTAYFSDLHIPVSYTHLVRILPVHQTGQRVIDQNARKENRNITRLANCIKDNTSPQQCDIAELFRCKIIYH